MAADILKIWTQLIGFFWRFGHDVATLAGRLFHACLPVHSVAWRVVSEPIELLLHETDPVKQDQMTERWRLSMLQQLATTILCAALIASVITTAFSWPSIPIFLSTVDESWSKRAVPTLWYISLFFTLTSIGSATNQAIALYRLAGYPDNLVRIRVVLSNGRCPPDLGVDRWQMWSWHIPMALLNGSLYLFLAGLAALFWNLGQLGVAGLGDGNLKINILFCLVLSFCVGSYIIASTAMYLKIKAL